MLKNTKTIKEVTLVRGIRSDEMNTFNVFLLIIESKNNKISIPVHTTLFSAKAPGEILYSTANETVGPGCPGLQARYLHVVFFSLLLRF